VIEFVDERRRSPTAPFRFDLSPEFVDLSSLKREGASMNSGSEDRDEDAARRARLTKLKSELKARAKAPDAAPPPGGAPPADGAGSAMSLGLRAGSEFVSAVVVGAAIGWGADRLLRTNPAFLILFFFLGVAAGVWNVIRLTSPKAKSSDRDSPLSRAGSPDKDGRRSALSAGHAASQGGREASGGALKPLDGADDNED
jgi:ATP synthase protein I